MKALALCLVLAVSAGCAMNTQQRWATSSFAALQVLEVGQDWLQHCDMQGVCFTDEGQRAQLALALQSIELLVRNVSQAIPDLVGDERDAYLEQAQSKLNDAVDQVQDLTPDQVVDDDGVPPLER